MIAMTSRSREMISSVEQPKVLQPWEVQLAKKCNNDGNHHQGGRLLCSTKSIPAFGAAAVELRSKRGKPFAIQVVQLFGIAFLELHKSSSSINLAFLQFSNILLQAAERHSRVETRRFAWMCSWHQRRLSSSSYSVLSQLQARWWWKLSRRMFCLRSNSCQNLYLDPWHWSKATCCSTIGAIQSYCQ